MIIADTAGQPPGKFRCACCKQVKDLGDRPESELRTEHEILFGEMPDDELVVVCDECFALMKARGMF